MAGTLMCAASGLQLVLSCKQGVRNDYDDSVSARVMS